MTEYGYKTFVSSFPLGIYTSYTLESLTQGGNPYPGIGYDPAGRLVVVVHEYEWGPVRVYFRTDGSWQSIALPGVFTCCCGAPALAVEHNTVHVCAEVYEEQPPYCFLNYCTLIWNSTAQSYEVAGIQRIGPCDYDEAGIVGNSACAAPDVVVWKYNNDIQYAQRTGREWTAPRYLARTDGVSQYPQGVVYGDATQRRLCALWTEQLDTDYYLVRTIKTLPTTYPHLREVAHSDIPEATGYNNSQRFCQGCSWSTSSLLHQCRLCISYLFTGYRVVRTRRNW